MPAPTTAEASSVASLAHSPTSWRSDRPSLPWSQTPRDTTLVATFATNEYPRSIIPLSSVPSLGMVTPTMGVA